MGRRSYDYIQSQKVLKKYPKPENLGLRKEGPYLITQVHTNGNVTIELRPGATERLNIWRVDPYLQGTHMIPAKWNHGGEECSIQHTT